MRKDGQKIVNMLLAKNGIDEQFKLVDIQSGSMLGCCAYRKRRIGINSCIVFDDDWLDTLLHEVAHAIEICKNNNYSHDGRFKTICADLQCCGMSMTKIEVDYTWKYSRVCGCESRESDRISEHKKRLYNAGCFVCTKCGDTIKLVRNR